MTFNEILHIIVFNRAKIIKLTFLSTLIFFLILFFVYPVTYKSEVTIMPPEKDSNMGGLGSLLGSGDISGLISGSGLSGANSQLFIEILKSRSASLYVVEKLSLREFYDADDNFDAAQKLRNNLQTDLTKEGIVKLSVDINSSLIPMIFSNKDSLASLSAKISNTYIEALDIINREKLSSKAKNARLYIETQLVDTKSKLDSSEYALMNFQQVNKAVSLPDQVKAAIDASAELKSEMVRTEIELGLLKSNVREESKTFIALSKKLQQLREQYNKFGMGNEDYIIAFKDLPDLGKELAGLLREVRIQNEVYLLLQQQYYKEKIQENRDISTVEILDEAIPPKRKSSPKVIYSTFVAGLFFFLMISIVFIVRDKKFYTQGLKD